MISRLYSTAALVIVAAFGLVAADAGQAAAGSLRSATKTNQASVQATGPGADAGRQDLAEWVQRKGFTCSKPNSHRLSRPAAPGWTTWHVKCESGWYRVTYAIRNQVIEVFAEPL